MASLSNQAVKYQIKIFIYQKKAGLREFLKQLRADIPPIQKTVWKLRMKDRASGQIKYNFKLKAKQKRVILAGRKEKD